MKKLILALTVLFGFNTQAQSPCDGITISGTQFGATIVVASTAQALFIETTSPNGIVLGQDSLTNSHYFQTGGNFNTVVTCIHTMNTMCCETFIWNGTSWLVSGGSVPSWNCSSNGGGCYDPGTGTGQYSTLSACQTACGGSPSWDCGPFGCFDPGTGNGQYSTLSTCQLACSSSSLCDSIIVNGSSGQVSFNAPNALVEYWVTTDTYGNILAEDSLTNIHSINFNGLPQDTVITCLFSGNLMCCETYVWNGTVWAKIGVTSIENEQIINFSSLYPNPVKDVAVLEFNSSKNTNISIAIYDIFGRQLSTSSIRISIGNNKINLETSKLANGYYLVNASCDEGEFKKTIQFTKQ